MHAYALLPVAQALHPTEKNTNVQLHNNNTNTNILLQRFYILFNYSVNNTITAITTATTTTTTTTTECSTTECSTTSDGG